MTYLNRRFLLLGVSILLWLTACQTNNNESPTLIPSPTILQTPVPSNPESSATAEVGDVPEQVPSASSSDAVAENSPYPGPFELISTPTPHPYPYPGVETESPDLEPTSLPDTSENIYLPITGNTEDDPKPVLPPTPAPVPTVDFKTVAAELEANGQTLGFNKIGFHVTIMEDRDILDNWMSRLDEAGVPIFIKTVDNAEPLFRAQELSKKSGVPHVLVYRSSGSVPLYELPAAQAAQLHWEEHKSKFPPELDPSMVWIETLNEPDRTKAEWLGQFALETARLAMADGFRWAAFGWASGEPEPDQWQTPSMLAFLQLAGQNPDQLAIAVHEYSYLKDEISHEYPYKVGRFLELFRISDSQGIPRPTVLITEWGWEYADIPTPEEAIKDIRWAAKLYAQYPQVKGAAIWNLGIGCCFDDISDQVQQIIEPVTQFSLTKYYTIPQLPDQQSLDPEQFRP